MNTHTHRLYKAFCPSKPGQDKCRQSSKSFYYTSKCWKQDLQKARYTESKWDMPDLLLLDQNKYKQKLLLGWLESRERYWKLISSSKEIFFNLLISNQKKLLKSFWTNILKNYLKYSHSKVPLHICKLAMFHYLGTLPRSRNLPWLQSALSFFTH